jgi:hypothetical protein
MHLAAKFGSGIPLIGTTLPDVGDPQFPAVLAVYAALAGGAYGLWSSRGSWRIAEREAFKFGWIASGFGALVYLFGLISDLY